MKNLTVADTIREIIQNHLIDQGGMLLGQCVTAVGWIGGTVPDCEGIVEIPMTDVAGPAFAVGAALMGCRPIFVVRYQGFMWYDCSSIVNYAAKSKQVWGVPVPIFIRSIAMEGNGVGHTASSSMHSIFMHAPGLPVVAPMTPDEYRSVWKWFMEHDDPLYVSEHRRSFLIAEEMKNIISDRSEITVIAISAGRLNAIESLNALRDSGIEADLFHLLWIKPFDPSEMIIKSLIRTGLGLVIDSDFEIAGASRSIAYELMHKARVPIFALGLEDRVCGVAHELENITPSAKRIFETTQELVQKKRAGTINAF